MRVSEAAFLLLALPLRRGEASAEEEPAVPNDNNPNQPQPPPQSGFDSASGGFFSDMRGFDYPRSPLPPPVPPPELRSHHVDPLDPDSCPSCPWSNPKNGRYPNPSTASPGSDHENYVPTHRGDYFDVYGHWIENRYGEVFWTAQPAVPLPEEIVEEFEGRAISITGFEVDVVAGGEDGQEEWSVPEFQVYNHHYCATIHGAAAKMTYVGSRAQDSLLQDPSRIKRRQFEVHPPEWEARDPTGGTHTSDGGGTGADGGVLLPTAHNVWQGNGGEHRKSFKHLPRGTGQLIESPREFVLQPMLINTNYPAAPGQTAREAFHAAPLPRNSLSPPGANYSGLMECPCTTRTTKVITGYETKTEGTCGPELEIKTAAQCFDAAAALLGGLVLKNVTETDAGRPSGCYLVAHRGGNEAHFNAAPDSAARCGVEGDGPVRSMGSASSASGSFRLNVDLDGSTGNATITLVGPEGVWFGVGFGAKAMADEPYAIIVDGDAGDVSERKLGNHMPGSVLPKTADVLSNTVGPAPDVVPPRRMNHVGEPLREDVVVDGWEACREMCGGEDECGAWTFLSARWATPYFARDGTCRLRRGSSKGEEEEKGMGAEAGAGTKAGDEFGFTSDGWIEGMTSGVKDKAKGPAQIRTVVLRRALKVEGDAYYDFDPKAPGIPFISAVGTTPSFQYHGPDRGGSSLVLVETGAPVCICKGRTMSGSINGIPFSNNCRPYPETTILRDHNPSCSIDTYEGGLFCCHHGTFLLDADQAVPEPTFRHRMKFRFYYEDPDKVAASGDTGVAGLYPGLKYQNAFFMFRETEASHGEYDVPRCADGTPPEECVHTVVARFTLKDAMHECRDRADVGCAPVNVPGATFPQSDHVALVHVSPHCHGPACISMEMVHSDTNATICRTSPHYGTGDQAMDEAGYAAGIPPCLWGTKEEGLPPPPVLSLDARITVIKRVNSTVGHRGVMGHWQMRAIWAEGARTGEPSDEAAPE